MPSGRELLRAWIDRMHFNRKEAAEYLGCNYVVLSQWLTGERTPALVNAHLIEAKTGIATESWLLTEVSPTPEPVAVDGDNSKIAGR